MKISGIVECVSVNPTMLRIIEAYAIADDVFKHFFKYKKVYYPDALVAVNRNGNLIDFKVNTRYHRYITKYSRRLIYVECNDEGVWEK